MIRVIDELAAPIRLAMQRALFPDAQAVTPFSALAHGGGADRRNRFLTRTAPPIVARHS